MPPPATTDELVNRLRRSGLVPVAELDSFLSGMDGDLPPRAVLDRLVADRMLTPFQADRLAVGKYKGFLLGGYVILDRIGTGGMGQVYLAEHATMRRLVAIKVMPAGTVAEDAVARERFFREARAAAVLNHPNIVRVFDLNKEGGLPYLVMEFIDGLSLQSLVADAGPLDAGAAADYARQVALGLQHACEKGLVHRDIKPGNILVDRHGAAKILDLGLVRNLDEVDTKLTSQLGGNSILGTADYLAPEQAVDSSSVDVRADVYSLGATLYFMLAGHPMFPEGRTAQKLMWQQWKEPTPIRELKPEVPDGLAAILHKAIAKKPAERFQAPQELADALAEYAVGPACPDPALIPPAPSRKWSGRASDPIQPAVQRTGSPPREPGSPWGAGGPSSAGGMKPTARVADPYWGHRGGSVPDDTPRTVQPTPPPQHTPFHSGNRESEMLFIPPPDGRRPRHPAASDEVPVNSFGEFADEPDHGSAKPPSRLALALGLLVGMIAAGGVAFWLLNR